MKLTITQPEIELILRAHIQNTIQVREDTDMEINFVATRSEDGITANIDIPYMGVTRISAIADAPSPAPQASTTKAEPSPTARKVAKLAASAAVASPKEDLTPKAPEPMPAQDSPELASDDTGTPEPAETAGDAQNTDQAPEEASKATRGPSLFSGFLAS